MSYRDTILDDAPIAYWKLDEPSGTTASDEVGGHDGTYTNSPTLAQTSLVTADSGYSVDFDGTNDVINLGGNPIGDALDGAAAVSVELWFNNDTWPSGGSYYVLFRVPINGYDIGLQFYLDGTSGYLYWNARSVLSEGASSNASYDLSSGTGTTHHIVGVADFANDEVLLYVDGSLVDIQSVAFTNTSYTQGTPTQNDAIGASAVPNYTLDGRIDEVAVYNYELTAAQVRRHYWEGKGYTGYPLEVLADGATSYWRLGEPSGTTASDETGSHDGTYSGSPTLAQTSLVASESDTSVDFDGTDDYVSIADHNDFSFGNGTTDSPFSIEAWVNMDDATSFRMVSKSDNGSNKEWQLSTDGTDYLIFLLYDQSSAGRIGVYANTTLTSLENSSVHIVATYNGGGAYTDIVVYVNGVSVALTDNSSGSYTAMENLASAVEIGRHGSSYANGTIDDVSIYPLALTAEQVAKHYYTGKNYTGYALRVLEDHPIAYWRLGEPSGTTASDELGNHDGTYTNSPTLGATGLIAGDSDTAVDFDGVNDYVSVPDSAALSFGNGTTDSPFSVEAWVNMDDATNFFILTKNDNSTNREWQINTDPSDNLVIVCYDQSAGSYISRKYSTTLTALEGDTLHIVGTYSGSGASSGMKLYLNGVQVDDTDNNSGTYTAMEDLTSVVEVGARVGASTYSNGRIDEAAIYDHELSAAEVLDHYIKGKNYYGYAREVMLDKPIAWWRLGESSGTTAADERLLQDGTYTNSPTLAQTSLVAGQTDTCVDFDGTNDFIDLGGNTISNALNGTAACTVEAWFNPDTLPTSSGWYAVFQAIVDTTASGVAFGLNENGAGTVHLEIGGRSVVGDSFQTLSYTWTATGTTSHIVGVIDFTNDALDLYVNGVNVANASVTFTNTTYTVGTPSSNDGIGAFSGGTAHYFDGTLDEVAIYDTELSASRIWQHYAAAAISISGQYDEAIAEAIDAMDALGGSDLQSLADSTQFNEALVDAMGRTIVENVVFMSGLGILGLCAATISFNESISGALALAVLENLELDEAINPEQVMNIIDALGASDDPTGAGSSFNRTLTDGLELSDALRITYNLLIAEDVDFTHSESYYIKKAAAVADALTLAGVFDTIHRARSVAAEILALQATAERYFDKIVTENVEISGALLSLHKAMVTAIETTALSDVSAHRGCLHTVVADSFTEDDTLTANQRLMQLLEEGFEFGGAIGLPDGTYSAWVMNTYNTGLSEYTNYPFNSFAELDGKYYGASSTGIYELTGATDAGTEITAEIKTGLMSFGTTLRKRVPEAYLGYSSDGRLVLKVSAIDQGQKKEYWYELTETNGAPDTDRIKIGKGLRARYWQFELANADGSDFDLDMLELYPVVLTRRVK